MFKDKTLGLIFGPHATPAAYEKAIEAALVAAHKQGWDERGEAVLQELRDGVGYVNPGTLERIRRQQIKETS